MKKNTYKLTDIDCAACALKIEDAVNKLDGVIDSKFNFIILTFSVTFDENILKDEQIEECMHKSLRGFKIVKKNNNEFVDNYKDENTFKKILFKGMKKIR